MTDRYYVSLDPARTGTDVLTIEELTAAGVRAIQFATIAPASTNEDDVGVCVVLFDDSPEGVADCAAFRAKHGIDYDLDEGDETDDYDLNGDDATDR